jgi:EmrB/QacA subfamily drug resistance transporter
MSTPRVTQSPSTATVQQPRSSRVTLGVILACQLMIGLDVTIVNVALPKIQASLHFSSVGQSWVLNMYALAFGGLVLLGGRVGDILGRRRVFMAGIAVFAVASLAGGLSATGWELIVARGVQGAAAAFAAPTALALLMVNFPEQGKRTRALAYYSIVTALGTSVGLILGGILVSWASWRWVLFVNIPIAAVVLLLTPGFIKTTPPNPGRFDLVGAVTSTAGMGLLVYGFVHAVTNGWGSAGTIAGLAVGVALLALFLFIETHVSQPVTPLWLFRDRGRTGGYVMIFLIMAAMYSLYFFGTQFMEDVLAYSPFRTGLSFLVTTLAAVVAARATAKLLPHLGAQRVLVVAAVLMVAGSVWMTQLGASSSYIAGLAGPLLFFGLGMGLSFPALNVTILVGIPPREAGAASGLLQAMQFAGGTIGLSVLVTIYGTAARNAAGHPPAGAATPLAVSHYVVAHGVASAYIAGVIFTACTLVIAAVVIRKRPAAAAVRPPQPEST